jgi:hypothetical protein
LVDDGLTQVKPYRLDADCFHRPDTLTDLAPFPIFYYRFFKQIIKRAVAEVSKGRFPPPLWIKVAKPNYFDFS